MWHATYNVACNIQHGIRTQHTEHAETQRGLGCAQRCSGRRQRCTGGSVAIENRVVNCRMSRTRARSTEELREVICLLRVARNPRRHCVCEQLYRLLEAVDVPRGLFSVKFPNAKVRSHAIEPCHRTRDHTDRHEMEVLQRSTCFAACRIYTAPHLCARSRTQMLDRFACENEKLRLRYLHTSRPRRHGRARPHELSRPYIKLHPGCGTLDRTRRHCPLPCFHRVPHG